MLEAVVFLEAGGMKVRFKLERAQLGAITDTAAVLDGETFGTAIADAVLADLSTRLEVTIANVTMHLGAWMDPEHWSKDWCREQGWTPDEVERNVHDLLTEADES